MATGETGPPTAHHNQRRAKPEAKHWLEYAIFIFVILTFSATGFAAWYTRRQWSTAVDSERRQLRAYIGVIPPKIEGNANIFIPPATPKVYFSIKNSGLTPGYAVIHQSAADKCSYPLPEDFIFSVPEQFVRTKSQPITVFPGIVENLGIEPQGARALTAEEFAALSDGRQRICFWGTINYIDAFGFSRYTNFCYSFFGTAISMLHQPCERHNDAD